MKRLIIAALLVMPTLVAAQETTGPLLAYQITLTDGTARVVLSTKKIMMNSPGACEIAKASLAATYGEGIKIGCFPAGTNPTF
jgi:hypothetical protein